MYMSRFRLSKVLRNKLMESQTIVYNAAREGKLRRLADILCSLPTERIRKLIHAKTNGATPLIMACRNGHLDVVKYLLEVCQADVEQVGQVTFDGETIDGAPPLWCAAAAGHLAIVKSLIQKGAGVNKTTFTNSTPLRAACFDGHFEIVKHLVECGADIEIANRHGHTCLMISCYKGHRHIAEYLLSLGADANRRSIKGNTALHDCAESGSLDIMKLLLEYGANMEKDSYGMTPLLAAAVAGYNTIVDFLIDRQECTRQEKIDALELLGATYVDKKRDMMGAITLWKQAMEERYAENLPPIPKVVANTVILAYENCSEVTTFEQLDDLISDPDDMRMQALLVRERILGPTHPDTSYYIRYRGALYADLGNFERCILLWMYALEMQQRVLDPLSPMTQSSFLSFAELFAFMTTDHSYRSAQPMEFRDVMEVLCRAIDELQRGKQQLESQAPTERDTTHFQRLLVITMHLLCLMCRLQRHLTEKEDHRLKSVVYGFVKLDPRGSKGYTPLHLTCAKETTNVGRYPVCEFPSNEVAKLLIEVGASVNAVDVEGNTPLHVAVTTKDCMATLRGKIIKTLLGSEAHLDTCNKAGWSALQLAGQQICRDYILPLQHINLQCLAARQIMGMKLPYKGIIPERLESFVEKHHCAAE